MAIHVRTEKPMYKKLDQAALDAILECGVDEFARCGFQPASVANVARAAGVSVGVIYKYFGDKQSLFLACVRHSLELLDATLREAMPEGAGAETSIPRPRPGADRRRAAAREL